MVFCPLACSRTATLEGGAPPVCQQRFPRMMPVPGGDRISPPDWANAGEVKARRTRSVPEAFSMTFIQLTSGVTEAW